MLYVQFTDTITLGAALIAAILGLFGLWRIALGVRMRTDNEQLKSRVDNLEGVITDRDRFIREQSARLNELGAEKDTAQQDAAACHAKVEALEDQLHKVPAYQEFMDYGRSMMEHVDSQAAARQESFMQVVVNELKAHDDRVQAAHAKLLAVLDSIAASLKER